jgi:hypothetical protein
MKNLFYISVLLFLMASCAGSKKASKDYLSGAPEWVRKSPSTPGYYHGVGSATKANTQMDYREKAKRNALSDLAGNISVKISAQSVLNQYEHDNRYSEYFIDKIKLSSEEYLEGYELVDTWENDEQYWVYYRLSKEKYEALKNQRKQEAVSRSEGDIREADNFKKSGNTKESIRFNVKALEEIKDFLAEDLTVEQDGKNEDYGSMVMSRLVSGIQSIRVVYPVDTLVLKIGASSPHDALIARVVDAGGRPLSGIALVTEFSYAPGKKRTTLSDSKGEIRIEIEKAVSARGNEYINTKIDLDQLIRESTDDAVIRKLLQNIDVPGYVLPVVIRPPVFFVETQEMNLGKTMEKKRVYPEMVNLLKQNGILIAGQKDKAEYAMTIKVDTQKGPEHNDVSFADLNAQISVFNDRGRRLYNKNIPGISGMGGSFEKAGLDAYDALISKLRISIFPEINKKLFGMVGK